MDFICFGVQKCLEFCKIDAAAKSSPMLFDFARRVAVLYKPIILHAG